MSLSEQNRATNTKPRHDDYCERSFLRNARCTCGATEAEQIVDDVTLAFARDLKEIMRAPR